MHVRVTDQHRKHDKTQNHGQGDNFYQVKPFRAGKHLNILSQLFFDDSIQNFTAFTLTDNLGILFFNEFVYLVCNTNAKISIREFFLRNNGENDLP